MLAQKDGKRRHDQKRALIFTGVPARRYGLDVVSNLYDHKPEKVGYIRPKLTRSLNITDRCTVVDKTCKKEMPHC